MGNYECILGAEADVGKSFMYKSSNIKIGNYELSSRFFNVKVCIPLF